MVTIGISEDSQFDFSISVSPLSIKTWYYLEMTGKVGGLSLLISIVVYVGISNCIKALKKRGHAPMEDEIEDINED